MKNIYIISMLLLCTLIVGCNKDSNMDMEHAQSVVITMNINNNTSASRSSSAYATEEGILGEAEYVVDRLRVYVFASDGELDKMEIYDNLDADHLIGKKIEVPKDQSKELYFVANEPSGLSTQLDGVASADELKQIEFSFAAEMNKGFNAAATLSKSDFLMPMSATYDVKSALSDISIYVGLNRAVARVDLFLHKSEGAASRVVELKSSTSLLAEGVTQSTKLFEDVLSEDSNLKGLNSVSSDVILATNTPQRVFSFYTAERKYNKSSSAITIAVDGLIDNGVTIERKGVTLGDAGTLTEIKRNHVYRILGSYNGTEIVAKELKVMDWTDVEVDGEIEGVMVAVDSEVAMDWLRNGNSFTSKSISFGSNKPIEIYLPISESGDNSLGYKFQRYEFSDMSAGTSYNLKDIALANNYIFATSWIESAIIKFTSPKSGYITFTYTPTKVNSKIQYYPIRIKSDNVTKQMKAVYDNGYIPASMLMGDWKDRAPGGVIFAKRGEANHPLTTPEVLYSDSDGYYRGEYKTTAEEGSKYCEQTFGDGWYMPSYFDMEEIAVMFDKLGVSYRFQNNGSANGSGDLTESRYWTSSVSTSEPQSYWSADFMSRDDMNQDLMERRVKTESHFVRCVKDLK